MCFLFLRYLENYSISFHHSSFIHNYRLASLNLQSTLFEEWISHYGATSGNCESHQQGEVKYMLFPSKKINMYTVFYKTWQTHTMMSFLTLQQRWDCHYEIQVFLYLESGSSSLSPLFQAPTLHLLFYPKWPMLYLGYSHDRFLCGFLVRYIHMNI